MRAVIAAARQGGVSPPRVLRLAGHPLRWRLLSELAFAPRNVAHALANHSDADARYLLVCTPAGLERHFARAAAAAQGVEPPDWALQPSPEIIVVGPQLAREP